MSNGNQIVLGLTGPFGAGCTTIADYLVEYENWRKYSLSDVMRNIAPSLIGDVDSEKLNNPEHRKYQQDIGNKIRAKELFSIPQALVEKIQVDEDGDKSLYGRDIVIDSIRNPSEMNYLRGIFPRFFVMAVFAPWVARWERIKNIYGERQGDFLRDDAQDSGEAEPTFGQKVQLCVDRSDILISNERQFDEPCIREELQTNVDSYVGLMKKPGAGGPHQWELNMGQAYQASLMSTCCKRKVGAIVAREESTKEGARSHVIACGYNEVPPRVRSCDQRGGDAKPEYCYKDEKIKEALKDEYKYCPGCGKELQIPEEFILPFICDCGARIGKDFIPGKVLDLCIAVHAEEAAILQASRFGSTQIEGNTLYTTTFPCRLCSKMIVHTGIEKVVFAEPYPEDEAINILAEAKVPTVLFEGVKGRAYHRLFEPPP